MSSGIEPYGPGARVFYGVFDGLEWRVIGPCSVDSFDGDGYYLTDNRKYAVWIPHIDKRLVSNSESGALRKLAELLEETAEKIRAEVEKGPGK